MAEKEQSVPLLAKPRKLVLRQRLAYSVGHVLNDLCASMWFSYLIIYFHQVKNFNNKLSGYIMLIGQISDALFTPFIGIESDRTEGIKRLGKRKTWHLIGSICVVCSFPFIFNKCITCDNASDWSQFIYFSPFVIIFQFGWAATQISHLSLIPDLTSDEHERVELNGLRYAFTVISNIIVFVIFYILFQVEGGKSDSDLTAQDSSKFSHLVFIVVGIGIFFSFIFHVVVKEKTKKDPDSLESESYENSKNTFTDGPSIEASMMKKSLMSWKDWLKEKQFYQVALLYMTTRLFVNVSQIYLPLFITETLKMEKNRVTIMPLIVYVSGFISSVLMRPLNKIIGRKAVFLIGVLLGIGVSINVHFLTPGTKDIFYGTAVILGIAGSTMLVTVLAMTADLIGENTESGAFVYGAMSFTDKLSNGVAVTLIQNRHPCTACCASCNGYFKTVLTFVPGGVAALALIVWLTLIPVTLGSRKQSLRVMKEVLSPHQNRPSPSAPLAVCSQDVMPHLPKPDMYTPDDVSDDDITKLMEKSPSINS